MYEKRAHQLVAEMLGKTEHVEEPLEEPGRSALLNAPPPRPVVLASLCDPVSPPSRQKNKQLKGVLGYAWCWIGRP